ncbi:hypothetical protein AiwAL_16560 [Acidiphilium sp. AL]|uniref:hypothetical protein n=1 Tax=Acidiphilium sp. AL TaxID=2871704 RepID=UPI0021CAF8AD|nr:hypothetical protein [Acidiphilium sp. AL]MCU4161693.1 hypothetical protein [Acidiphilium sp. AL]
MDHPIERHKAIQLVSGDTSEKPAMEQARRLAELAEALDELHSFRKGQFVRWKSGLRNKAVPAYNEIAIVREVLATPVFDTCEQAMCAGSPYFGEPLTLVLAILDPDCDFLEFRYDGRRVEPVEP